MTNTGPGFTGNTPGSGTTASATGSNATGMSTGTTPSASTGMNSGMGTSERERSDEYYRERRGDYGNESRHWGRDDDRNRYRESGGGGGNRNRGRNERGIFISTEARHGFVTTEFWLTLIGVVGLVIMAYNSDMLGVRWGMGMATAVLLGYILSRGFAKAGSSEMDRRKLDDFD